jgi:hypothetical protein
MPRVLNKHRQPISKNTIFIGRPSKWGNPFIIGRHGDRAQVVAAYRNYIEHNPQLKKDLHELKGKDLVCYCSPLPCHGDVLLELANAR